MWEGPKHKVSRHLLWSPGRLYRLLVTVCDNPCVLPTRDTYPSLRCPEFLLGLSHTPPTLLTHTSAPLRAACSKAVTNHAVQWPTPPPEQRHLMKQDILGALRSPPGSRGQSHASASTLPFSLGKVNSLLYRRVLLFFSFFIFLIPNLALERHHSVWSLISKWLPHPSSLRICSRSHLPWRTKKNEQTSNQLRPPNSKRTSVSKVFIIKQEICCLQRKSLQILFFHMMLWYLLARKRPKQCWAVTSK